MRRLPLGMMGAVVLALASTSLADSLTKADSFLDRPLPADLKLGSFTAPSADGKEPDVKYSGLEMGPLGEEVQWLGRLSGKRIVLPDYLAAALARDHAGPAKGGFWGVTKNQQVRPLFNEICFSIGMTWRYDPQRDDIVLDMAWRRDDPRSGTECVDVLNREAPVSWEKLPAGPVNLVGGHGKALDAWRVAFDALLSKPENLSTAGRVRIYHDSGSESVGGAFPVVNLLSKKMRDISGRPETLILNTQLQMTNKEAPGPVAYYLFDEQGRFIKGGIYAMGDGVTGMVTKAEADSDSSVTIDVGWGSFAMNPDHAHFQLENGDLVLKGATDSSGRTMTAEEARTSPESPPRHMAVSMPNADLAFKLNPNESRPVVPAPVAPAPVKPTHWHGAMGVLKFSVAGADHA